MPVVDFATWPIKLSDAAIIAATLAGPILAVQAQKWLERGRAIQDRQAAIFRTLMATRATRLSPAHVEALNAVPVEFFGTKPALKAITEEWNNYLLLLEDRTLSADVVTAERLKALMSLLHKISAYLGYDFSLSQLQRGIYYPEGHKAIEEDAEIIRRGLASLFKGQTAIPMNVVGFPYDENAGAEQEAMRRLLTEWLDGKRAVKVEQP